MLLFPHWCCGIWPAKVQQWAVVSFAGPQLSDTTQQEPLSLNLLICSWTQLPARPTRQRLWTTGSPITFCLWTTPHSLPPAPKDTGHVSNGSPLKSLHGRAGKGKILQSLKASSVLLREAFCRYSAGSSCQRAKGNQSISENQASCLSPQIWAKSIQEQLYNTLLPRRNRERLILSNLCRETKFQGKSTDNNPL